MIYHFPKKILGSRISSTYKRLMKILRGNLGKILRKSYKVSKIRPLVFFPLTRRDLLTIQSVHSLHCPPCHLRLSIVSSIMSFSNEVHHDM